MIGKLAGVDEFPRGELSVSTKETAKSEAKAALSKDIKNLGV